MSGAAPDPGGLAAAEATDRGLREQIADLVRARARADAEARRLADRATTVPEGEPLEAIRERYVAQASRLGEEVEALRGELRAHEPVLEELRARSAGA